MAHHLSELINWNWENPLKKVGNPLKKVGNPLKKVGKIFEKSWKFTPQKSVRSDDQTL